MTVNVEVVTFLIAVNGILIAIIGFLAKSALDDMKYRIDSSMSNIKMRVDDIAHRIVRLERAYFMFGQVRKDESDNNNE